MEQSQHDIRLVRILVSPFIFCRHEGRWRTLSKIAQLYAHQFEKETENKDVNDSYGFLNNDIHNHHHHPHHSLQMDTRIMKPDSCECESYLEEEEAIGRKNEDADIVLTNNAKTAILSQQKTPLESENETTTEGSQQ